MTPQTKQGFEKWMPFISLGLMVMTSVWTIGYQKAIFDQHSKSIEKLENKVEEHEHKLNTNDREHDGFNYRLNAIDLRIK